MSSLSNESLLLLARATVSTAPQTLVVDWNDPFEFERWDKIMQGYTCTMDFSRTNFVDGKPMFRFCVNLSDPRHARIIELHKTLPLHSLSMNSVRCDECAFLSGSPLVHLECRNMELAGDIVHFQTEHMEAHRCNSKFSLDCFLDMPCIRSLRFYRCIVLDVYTTCDIFLTCNRHGHWHVTVYEHNAICLHALYPLFARCKSIRIVCAQHEDFALRSIPGVTHVEIINAFVEMTGDWDALEEVNFSAGSVNMLNDRAFTIAFGDAQQTDHSFSSKSFCSLRCSNKRTRR